MMVWEDVENGASTEVQNLGFDEAENYPRNIHHDIQMQVQSRIYNAYRSLVALTYSHVL